VTCRLRESVDGKEREGVVTNEDSESRFAEVSWMKIGCD
jgi:hypothetical protein